jgi:hypothetical protein
MMAADRQRQQNGAADLPLFSLAMKADRERDSTNRRAQHDRDDHERRIPQDDARDFKRSHPGVVHGGDAAGDNGATNPWPVAPVRDQRYRQPRAGQQDGRHQRQDG